MLFRRDVLDRIKRGDITLVYRRWRRAAPAEGSTLRTAAGVLALTRISAVEEAAITEDDARRAGFVSRADLLASLAPDGTIYRMTVRVAGDDPRLALRDRRLTAAGEAASELDRLRALDRRSRRPWLRPLLQVVADRPGVAARQLADVTAMDRDALKRRMRQLKELGLTESLQVGYRLSPRGRDALALLGRERRGA